MASSRTRADLTGGLYATVAAVAFGAVTVIGKEVTSSGLSVTTLLALRFGSASLFVFAALAITRQRLRPAPGELWKLVALGVVGYGVESSFFYLSLTYGTATAVTLLFSTYPVVVAIASVALGRGMPGWLVGGSLVAAVGGAAFVVGSGGGIDITPLGVVFALTSAVTFTAYLLGAEAVLKDTPSMTGAAWTALSASLGLFAWSLATGNLEAPANGQTWLGVLSMGAGTALAFVMLFAALRRLGAVRTSVVSALEPVAAAGFAIAFLGEPLRVSLVLGGALILAGAVAASLARGHVPEGEVPLPP
jgi:drug/metabolite transporter (DMT)-like permease